MPPLVATEPPKAASKLRDRLLTTFHILVVAFVFLVCAVAYLFGFLFNLLFLLLLILPVGMVVYRAIGFCFGNVEFRFLCRPFDRVNRKYWLQCLNQWTFVVATMITLKLSILPIQLETNDYRLLQVMTLGCSGAVILLGLIPHRQVRVSTNSFFLVGWLFLGLEFVRIFSPPGSAESVVLDSPFHGESYIFHGGRSVLINHHYPILAQRHALDIIQTKKNGREFEGDENLLTSYAGYGETLYSPADGQVVKMVQYRKDMEIGQTDSEQIIGNHVILDIGEGRFVLMAHLKKGSILVVAGDRVKRGQPLAQCGNSGNTSAPHLHLQVQSDANFDAKDLKTFPILFRDVTRLRSGKREQLKEADVRRNDILISSEAIVGDPH